MSNAWSRLKLPDPRLASLERKILTSTNNTLTMLSFAQYVNLGGQPTQEMLNKYFLALGQQNRTTNQNAYMNDNRNSLNIGVGATVTHNGSIQSSGAMRERDDLSEEDIRAHLATATVERNAPSNSTSTTSSFSMFELGPVASACVYAGLSSLATLVTIYVTYKLKEQEATHSLWEKAVTIGPTVLSGLRSLWNGA